MIFNFEKPFTFDRVMRILFTIVVFALIFFILKALSGVLLPFFIAWLVAYLTYPMVKFFQYRLKFKFRSLSIFASLITICTFVGLLLWLVVPSIVAESEKFVEIITNTSKYFNENYREILSVGLVTDIDNFIATIDVEQWSNPKNVWEISQKIMPEMWNIVSGMWAFLLSIFVVFLIFLYCFFILLDYETLSDGWKKLIPLRYRDFTLKVASDVETSMNRYFRSQALIAFCVGAMFCIGFEIIGLPLALLMGIFLGILNLVPYLQTVGIVPVVLLAIVKSAESNQSLFWILISVLIVFVVVQVIQDMLLTPKIMGKSMSLNPAVILLSLSIFGYLLGIIGMIIALPFTTLIISYYKQFVLNENKNTESQKL